MSSCSYEIEKLYSKLRFAVLLIADNYHMMHKEDMTTIDMRNVEAVIDSGVGSWRMDEFNDKFYWFGK